MKHTGTKSLTNERVYLRAVERIHRIHKEIASGGYPNVQRLAKILCVNERTIKRDIAFLKESFLAPIHFDRKHNGYTYSDIQWTMPLQTLSEGELLAFFVAEYGLRLIGQSDHAQKLKNALSKLAVLLPEKVSIDLFALSEAMNFEDRPIVSIAPSTLQCVTLAAIAGEQLEFTYFSPYKQESSRRTADVHLVHNYAGDWYAISYDHKARDFRDFHIGRISDIRPTGRSFEPQKGWNKEEYLRRGFSMTRGGRLTTVEIVFDSYQAQWMRERQKFHPDETREELPDGSLRIRFKVGEAGLEAVARFCLQYAGNCIAEKPKKLREIIMQKLERSTRQYLSTT